MSIASEFDSTIENIKSDYEGLENIGADLTNIDKNIYNIRTCLDNIYTNLPKTTGEGSNLSLTTLKGRINVDDILGDTEQRNLPSAYQQIEYIESTGEAYIDTGVIPNTNTKIDIQFETIKKGTYGVIFGGEEIFGANAFHLYTYFDNFDMGFDKKYTAEDIPYNINTKYTLVMDKTGFTLNDITGTFASNTITTTNSVYLFAVHRATNVIDSDAQKRIYYCKLYNNGTLVRNLIPCYRISDNVIGMYDLVSNTFFTNIGSGTFTKGGNATPTPSSPQDINVVTGQQEVVVQNANILDTSEIKVVKNQTGDNRNGYYCKINTTGTYTLILNTTNTMYFGKSTNLESATTLIGSTSATYTTNYTFNEGEYFVIWGTKTDTDKLMVALGTSLPYIEHQEQTKTLHLGDIELAKIGTYKNRIFESSGKNKFDSNNVIENALIQPSNNKIGATSECTTIWFKCTPNTTYTLSRDKGDRLVIGGSNTQPALNGEITTLYDIGVSEVKTYTFNSGNFEYVAIYISRYNTSKPTIIMINEGSTALPYEPYGSDKWYIEKNIHKIANKTNWVVGNMASNNRCPLPLNSNGLADTINSYNGINCISNCLIATSQGTQATSTDINTISINNANAYVKFDDATNTKELVKAKMNSMTNLVLYYILKTPTYTEITNETLLNELNELEKMMSYNGQTNISVSGNLPMILDVSALKGE